MSEPLGMLAGTGTYRVRWLPGTDTLHGICHCGAERAAEEPVELWEWLLAHPSGHRAPQAPAPQAPAPLQVPPARTELPV